MSMIVIQRRKKDGIIIPVNGEIMWYGIAAELDTNLWEIDSALTGNYVRGAAVESNDIPAGNLSHDHAVLSTDLVDDHNHTILAGVSAAATPTISITESDGVILAATNHTHNVGAGISDDDGAHSHETANTNMADIIPPTIELYWIKALIAAPLPVGGIVMWSDTAISAPPGLQICNGINGRPDLRDKFVYGAAQDINVGSTYGFETHLHTNPDVMLVDGHTHPISGVPFTGGATSNYGHPYPTDNSSVGVHSHGGSGTLPQSAAHNHSLGSTKDGSSLPPYIRLYYLIRME